MWVLLRYALTLPAIYTLATRCKPANPKSNWINTVAVQTGLTHPSWRSKELRRSGIPRQWPRDLQDDNIVPDNPHESWKNVTTRTVTTSIKRIQQTLNKERIQSLTAKDIAKALSDRNLLRQTHMFQISSNKKLLSIAFNTPQTMETFCTESLLVRGFNINFRPVK